ncbi:ABC transporter permease [Nocardia fluminea]|uniref:Peptide/nickel transport system permease protein n=1 Tax=Nocardia fluminea TaxID=134984 RepID=A0A2N3WVW9_9NOCA|nr:ABC transporter permease [Nocardia fluminea]PKV98027.1 peptide/nickel transport system permease protein [Nocardia fluminea]
MVRTTRLVLAIVFKRVAMLFVLLALVHAAVAFLPGNGVRSLLGKEASAEQIAATERQLGLDRPWPVRYVEWLRNLAGGDLGQTLRGTPVVDVLGAKFLNTLLLGGLALVVTATAAIAFGSMWALRPRSSFSRAMASGSTVMIAVPEFVLAAVFALVFAVWLGWLPAVTIPDGAGRPESLSMLVLPTIALAVPQTGWNVRVVHSALIDAGSTPAVHAAELDGLSKQSVLWHNILPSALPSIATSLATTIGPLLAGTLVVETIFNYPGIGSVLAGSVADRDATLALTIVALAATSIMVMLLLADLLRAWVVQGRR